MSLEKVNNEKVNYEEENCQEYEKSEIKVIQNLKRLVMEMIIIQPPRED